jgi:hypothetical protein
MNELVALCMYVVLQGQYGGINSDGMCARLCGEAHNESDLFILFSALMEFGGLRDMFEVVKAKPVKTGYDLGESALSGRGRAAPQHARSAILARCDHIYNTILKKLDSQLHSFLVNKGVEPQIFMLRWLRLLFCREFSLDDTLALWTHIFVDSQQPLSDNPLLKYTRKPGKGSEGVAVAEASSMALPLVDFFAAAMIMYLKSQLLEEDDNCLTVLMRPEFPNVQKLVELARQFRSGAPATPTAPAPAVAAVSTPPVQPKATAPLDAPAPSQAPPPVARETSPAKLATTADSGSLAAQVAELRRKVEKLEQEKVAIATKGREFIAKKTAEFNAKVAELENRTSDRGTAQESGTEELRIRIAELEDDRQKLHASATRERNELSDEVQRYSAERETLVAEKNVALEQLASQSAALAAANKERDVALDQLASESAALATANKERDAALEQLSSESAKLATANAEVAELKRQFAEAEAKREADQADDLKEKESED